ncbi:flagellin modification protein, PseA [Candidatus Giovannonibacteria bacterium RIFCSPHIGHO2_02_FULL_46_20]|uniref:Flagellin modification protein, PseA n=1 Tax=Candidatus Giovannonibacteria bacterium RIFCSPHIGHO2_02_FULL_46_20 TaxID=1798338 RepID=A0A1F5WEJ4_9BACT|nr:MAG: flagellin modification protein, PseA [Candidatus Giovannonibacteria bacterium RIFCSPHIGHO2_02_FULL_46_20]
MPNTKPDLFFDDMGVCDACRSTELKKSIDWALRKKEFEELLDKYRGKNGNNYDCIVPASGGKDSHYQAYMVRKVYGMNPLLVCFEATKRTPLGRKNLDNIKSAFGVDLVELQKNPEAYKKMCLEGFRRVGDHEWPNHLGIFTFPVRVAVQQKIPLIIWGENSQLEYGGPKAARMKSVLDRRWLEEFGGLLGHRVDDMIGVDGITKEDLVAYMYPNDEELKTAGITSVFLGYYFLWDARSQIELMQKHGFSAKKDGPVEGTYTNYENLDDNLVAVHDYMKFVKFGFGRATDHACLDVRNGRMMREEAVATVQKYDGKLPKKGIAEFLEFFGMKEEEFSHIVDSFTNKAIFETDTQGNLFHDNEGNLVKRYQYYGSGLPKEKRIHR